MNGLDLADLLEAYGYWMVAIGSFVEGESVLMLAGAAGPARWNPRYDASRPLGNRLDLRWPPDRAA